MAPLKKIYLEELGKIQERINSLFEQALLPAEYEDTEGGPPGTWSPAVDVLETEDSYLLFAELPGLIKPTRSAGNTRLYDEEAIRRLEIILTLTRDLGVNLAGVEVILNMKERMDQMQGEVDRLLEYVKREAQERRMNAERQHALVKVQSGPLTKYR